MKNDDRSWLPPAGSTPRPRRSSSSDRYLKIGLTAASVGIGLLLSGITYNTLLQNEELRVQRDFALLAEERVRSVAKTMAAYTQVLYATRALFDASEHVTRTEFKQFVQVLLEQQSGIRALEWVPRITRDNLASHEEAARRDGFNFRIRGIDNAAADSDRDRFPVFYVEPWTGNDAAFGIDLASDPVRKHALERAARTGEPAATTPLDLVQDPEQAKSTLVFLAHYDGDTRDSNAAQRSDMLVGFVLGVFRLPDLLHDATSGQDSRDVDISLSHGNTLVAGGNTNDREQAPSAARTEAGGLERIEALEMGGHNWTVRCTPTARFLSSQDTARPAVGLLFALILTGVAAAYVYVSLRSAEIRRALAQSEERYRTVVDHAPEGIMLIGVEERRFVGANENACKMFGLSREELLQTSLIEISAPIQPDGRPTPEAAKAYIESALNDEEPVFIWTHLDPDGNEFPCEVRLVMLPSSEGAVIRGSVTDISERVRSEERQALMMRELDHRVKNNLATVLSLTEQSAADAHSAEELRQALAGRIRGLADLHRALARKQWGHMDLGELFSLTFAPYNKGENSDRIHLSGERLMLPPDTCTALCMVAHELATNAVKYGALSKPEGRVDVSWQARDGESVIEWKESGGPAITAPDSAGYGTRLINGLIQHQLGGSVKVNYAAEGLACRIVLPSSPS